MQGGKPACSIDFKRAKFNHSDNSPGRVNSRRQGEHAGRGGSITIGIISEFVAATGPVVTDPPFCQRFGSAG